MEGAAHVSQQMAPAYLWQVLEAQADDMFALYQLGQLLMEATDLDELVHLALPQLVRVSDSPYAALFLQVDPEGQQELVSWIGPDVDEEVHPAGVPRFGDNTAAAAWFRTACGLDDRDCMFLPLQIGRSFPGLLALAAPSRDGFSHHEQHLLATMAREVARVLQLALARADLRRRQEKVEQMQADFVTAVSHELRTPLALAQASVDSLTHLDLSPGQQRRIVEDIGRSTAQLTRIVDAILDFSRVEEGRWDLHIKEVDLEELVPRMLRECFPADLFRIQPSIPSIWVRGDAERLTQVISNIVQNALKYSPSGSPVHLSAHASPRHGVAWLHVRDRGQGIPADDQPFLFTKFFRAGNARESAVAGTGLGLYIARRLIEALGGAIRVRSRAGRGTDVRIALPLWQAEPQHFLESAPG
jgi:signal transduction histidine kinase